MTGRIVALVAANVSCSGSGAGMLPLLGLARTPQQLLAKLPLAYAVGLVTTGVLAAELAVVGVPFGWIALAAVTAVALGVGLRRVERVPWEPGPPLLQRLPAFALLGIVVAFLASAAGLFAVKPLFETDGWMLWAMRARALYEFGHPVAPVFTSAEYPGLTYPLWLPALEAADFRFMGAFDGTLVHLQLAGLAAAFVGGAWVLLRSTSRPFLLAGTLLAIVTAPSVFNQLQTNFADIPLAMLISLGVVALAVWLRTGEPGLLPAAALFLGAGTLTKSEGLLFALAALAAAAIVAPPRAAAAARGRHSRDGRDLRAVGRVDLGAPREGEELLALEPARPSVPARAQRPRLAGDQGARVPDPRCPDMEPPPAVRARSASSERSSSAECALPASQRRGCCSRSRAWSRSTGSPPSR